MNKLKLQSFATMLVQNASRLGWMIIAVSLLFIVFALSGCSDGGDDSANPQHMLQHTWEVTVEGSIKKNGSDVSGEYTGLKITFTEAGTYSSVSSGPLFNTSGTWAWQGTGITDLLLDGDFDVRVVSLTETDLHLQFTLEADDVNGGRVASLVGDYDVKLKAAN